MRLKFRAWDGYRMAYCSEYNSLEAFFAFHEDKGYYSDPSIIQQFTGLQDKNGKEIYEGDILKYPQDRIGYYDTMVVEWETEFDGFGGLNCGFRMGGDYATQGTTEVIGNIFENSQLLNEPS
jgi:uncharacterized phage protein (TIGR01671 family)